MPNSSRSSTTTEGKDPRPSSKDRLPPVHPGEMLREDFLVPLGLSANALALALHVPATRISEIVNERRGISADTAIRLGLYFGTTPEFWMNIQSFYDLQVALDSSSEEIQRNVRPAAKNSNGDLLSRIA